MQSYIDRLTKAGIPLACADEIVTSYFDDNDEEGLKRYVNLVEKGYTLIKGVGSHV